MDTLPIVFAAIMPVLVIVISGFWARRLNWLELQADASIMRLVVHLFYPSLIFYFILGNEALRNPFAIVLPPLAAFLMVVGGFIVALRVAAGIGIKSIKTRRTFALSTGLFNYGYFAIPVSLLVFGREVTGVLLVFNLGVDIALWFVGVGFLLGGMPKQSKLKRFFSPPVAALLIALLFNFLGLDRWLPRFVIDAFGLLGACAIPLGVLLIGAVSADLVKEMSLFKDRRITAAGVILRQCALPFLFLLTAWLLPLPRELKAVIVVQSAMPCGILPIVLARYYGGDAAVAIRVIMASIIVCAFTIPFWITLGILWLGLKN
jgi:predicted permease